MALAWAMGYKLSFASLLSGEALNVWVGGGGNLLSSKKDYEKSHAWISVSMSSSKSCFFLSLLVAGLSLKGLTLTSHVFFLVLIYSLFSV
jgi:hypothetical protein